MLFAVVNDERCDEAGLQRDLAAWKALAATAAKPGIGIIPLSGACPSEGALQRDRGDAGDRGGIDRLPEHVTQLVVVAKPQRAAQFRRDNRKLEVCLNRACPDARLIQCHLMIDAERAATGMGTGPDQGEHDPPRGHATHRFSAPHAAQPSVSHHVGRGRALESIAFIRPSPT